MRVVIADASPLNYLILIDSVEILRHLYSRVVIPDVVLGELTAAGAPASVAGWMQARPDWIEVQSTSVGDAVRVTISDIGLDSGELAAIQLALVERDSLLFIDEAAGRKAAARLGVAHTGTLGVLLAGAKEGLIDLPTCLTRLQGTNFRISQALIDTLLEQSRR